MQVESAKYVFWSWVVPLWIRRLLCTSSMCPRHSGCVPCTRHTLIYLLISQVYLTFFFLILLLFLFLDWLKISFGSIVIVVIYWLIVFVVIYWLIVFFTFDTVWSSNVIFCLSLSLSIVIIFGFIRLLWLLRLNSILDGTPIYWCLTKTHRKWPFLSTIHTNRLLISIFVFFKNLIDVLIVYLSHFLLFFVLFDLLYDHDVIYYDFTFQNTTEWMLEACGCTSTRLSLF